MELRINLHDHVDVVHSCYRQDFDSQVTLKQLKEEIYSLCCIAPVYQKLYFEDGTRLNGLGTNTLQSLGVKDGSKVIVKHAELDSWVAFLGLCDTVNNPEASNYDREGAAKLAVDLSKLLDKSKFYLAYPKFLIEFEEKRGQAIRAMDKILPAAKESARLFFANMDPESIVKFEPKRAGIMPGTIVKVIKGETLNRYFLKTYHQPSTGEIINTPDHFPPNLIETFVYRLLNRIDAGPIVHFPYYSKSFNMYFIMTEQVDGFQELEQIKDADLQTKIVVEAYILRLILRINDLSSENFGVDKRNMLSMIDFWPPYGDSFLQPDIKNDFMNKNKIMQFDVNQILSKISPEKRIEIAKAALDRWTGFRTVTSEIIDDVKDNWRRHGDTFKRGSGDIESYIKDIKENYETLCSGLQ